MSHKGHPASLQAIEARDNLFLEAPPNTWPAEEVYSATRLHENKVRTIPYVHVRMHITTTSTTLKP